MSIFAQFELDKAKLEKGTPVKFAPNADGSIPTFYVKRSGSTNDDYSRILNELLEPFGDKELTSEENENIMNEVFVRSCLVKWDGVKDRKGVVVEFSEKRAIQLAKELPELFNVLKRHAANFANYRVGELEDDAKN